MCACDWDFTCARCRTRWPLNLDPYYVGWREEEQERVNSDLSRVDFEESFKEGL